MIITRPEGLKAEPSSLLFECHSGRDDQPFNGLDFPVFDSSNLILPISNIARENIIHQSDPHPNEIGHSLVSRYIINEIEKRWQI